MVYQLKKGHPARNQINDRSEDQDMKSLATTGFFE
jgi:hypothetical protein